jgi:hypothetical protein
MVLVKMPMNRKKRHDFEVKSEKMAVILGLDWLLTG